MVTWADFAAASPELAAKGLHSAISDRDGTEGEFKVYGRAAAVDDRAIRERYCAALQEAIGWAPDGEQWHLWYIDINQVSWFRAAVSFVEVVLRGSLRSKTMKHHVIDAFGTRIHFVEEGTGPMVLLVHGFPESWYSWRHQMPALAEAGFRAVAVDVRGYGRSGAPPDIDSYGMLRHVNDNLCIVDALGERTATIIGHDWGSPIAANSALLRPEVFTAVALLSVPYTPPGPHRPTAVFAAMGGDEEFYINYFQEPGRAEAEAEIDVRGWLLGFYIGASGDAVRPADGGTIGTVRRGGMLRDRFVIPDELPAWLTEEDVEFYAGEFERTGFRGALNRYRNIDRDWLDLQPWSRQPITVASLFIGGERDGPTIWGQRAIDKFPQTMPGLRGSHVLPGCGHWVQQERAAEVNEILLEWLKGL